MALNKPVFKIEVLTPDDDIRHTITKHAYNIDFKQTLTENIGTFSFNLPIKRADSSYKYRDVSLFDKIKIYLGWGTIPTDPLFIGRVMQIVGVKSSPTSTIRQIKGIDEGEILLRRLKEMDDWVAENASDIAAEIATDLSLGTGEITADTTDETHRIDIDKFERYFDLLKKVSDYWYDADTKVSKDFRVWNGDLIWKARPIRTLDARFTIAKNIVAYTLVRDLTNVKNKIYVYGKRGKPHDASLDDGTDMATPDQGNTTVDVISASGQKVLSVTATAAFSVDDTVIIFNISGGRYEKNIVDTIQAGVSLTMDNNLANTYQVGDVVVVYPGWFSTYANNTLSVDAANKKIGDRSIKTTAAGASHTGLAYYPTSLFNLNYYPRINFYACSTTDANSIYIRFYDTAMKSAVYEAGRMDPDGNKFIFFQIPAGRDNENSWVIDSGFNWADVWQVDWTGYGVVNGNLLIDGFFLDNRRYQNSAENATSQGLYGLREMAVVDENLSSDTMCQSRAEILLYQMKDPVIRCDLETRGYRKVVVGDRVPLTLPAEKISAVDFDVVTIQHRLFDSWKTYYIMLNTAYTRNAPAISLKDYLVQKSHEQREIGKEGVNVLK